MLKHLLRISNYIFSNVAVNFFLQIKIFFIQIFAAVLKDLVFYLNPKNRSQNQFCYKFVQFCRTQMNFQIFHFHGTWFYVYWLQSGRRLFIEIFFWLFFSIFEGKRQIKSCTFFATLNIALRENPKNNACLQIK